MSIPPDSPYTASISAGVLALQERGTLKSLKIRWWKKLRGGYSMIIVGPDRCSEKTWKPPPCWDKILNLSPFISAKNFKWPPGGTCNKDTTGTSAQLSLAQLGGVFIVLVGGMVGITIIIIIIFLAQHDDVYIINRMVKTPINCNYDCEKEFSLVNCIVTKQHWKRQTSWWPGAGDHHCRLRVCMEEEEAACRPKC